MNSRLQLNSLRYGVIALLLAGGMVSVAACALDNPDPGELSGPSELGTAVDIRAVPDQLVSDGFSSAVIEAVVRGPDGARTSGVEVLFDITRQGAGFLDLGNLASLNSPRPSYSESGPVSSVSDGEGVARARYWAPFRTDQENDATVIITGRPSGTNFNTALFRTASIFLRAADRPSFPGSGTCGFLWEPAKLTYRVGEGIAFTATQLVGDVSISGCVGNEIARYEWIFDAGKTYIGRNVVHAFSTVGAHPVILVTHEAVTGCRATCTADYDIVN